MAEGQGILRVVTPSELQAREAALPPKQPDQEVFRTEIARHIRNGFDRARSHRLSEFIDRRLHDALRTYKGEYSPEKLAEIAQFKGSQVYARLTSVKCRGASSLMRDIYIHGERPWQLEPTPEPKMPGDIMKSIAQLVNTEVQVLRQGGQQIDPQMIEDRMNSLIASAKKAEGRRAKKEAAAATRKLDDILTEGGFYTALDQVIVDLPIFPYVVLKGPVVRNHTQTRWSENGMREQTTKPKMFWDRVSPFDFYWSPGASDARRASTYERLRMTRDELYALIKVPGYDEEAIRNVLDNLGAGVGGLTNWTSMFEGERANLENREDPNFDGERAFIDVLEFQGMLQGQWLLDWGLTEDMVADPQQEYFSTAWLISNEIIKVQLQPAEQRPSYYVTSFEKVPGSVLGNALPDILVDIQDVTNATLRALVNNMGIASGPQVVIDDSRLVPGSDDQLYPWKRWHVQSDPYSSNQPPVTFTQPESRAQELLGVYKEFTNMADEISAIPRYLTGSQRTGGAASTASGLAMLMNNSGKVLQNVAGNIDADILDPVLTSLYDLVMLTSPGELRGDESIVVRGVTTAIQREQDRVRQLEFLSLTANPLDAQIVGPRGRASVLRAVAGNIGLEYDDIVADDEQIAKMIEQQQMAAAQANSTGEAGPSPNGSRSDGATPRMDQVSNASTM